MELSFKVNKPVDCVFDFLTDMQKFVSIHPVITNIENISGNNYLIHERQAESILNDLYTQYKMNRKETKNGKLWQKNINQ